MRLRDHKLGFTLVEMLITIAILAILTTLALPSFRDTFRRNAVVNESNRLVISLQTARARAISGAFRAGVCTSSVGGDCAGGTPSRYDKGFAIFVIPQNVLPPVRRIEEYLAEELDGKIHILSSNPAANDVTFDRLGRLTNLGVGVDGVQFAVCYEGNSTDRVPGLNVFVTRSGRITQSGVQAAGICNTGATEF